MMSEAEILEIIREWKWFWMNQTQNSEDDRLNYYRRSHHIDANMQHDLAGRIIKALRDDKQGARGCEVSAMNKVRAIGMAIGALEMIEADPDSFNRAALPKLILDIKALALE